MARVFLNIILLLVFAGLTAFVSPDLDRYAFRPDSESANQREALYLPSEDALRFVSFGYRNLLADILWFNTVSYFGKHYRLDGDYRWLNHMCNLVTSLDGRRRHVFEFCSTMLAWELGAPADGIAILAKGIAAEPDYWKYHYLRGFTYLFFMNSPGEGSRDLMKAAELPGAPVLAARLAAKKLSEFQDPGTALEFLDNILAQTSDPYQRRSLEKRRRQLAKKLLSKN